MLRNLGLGLLLVPYVLREELANVKRSHLPLQHLGQTPLQAKPLDHSRLIVRHIAQSRRHSFEQLHEELSWLLVQVS